MMGIFEAIGDLLFPPKCMFCQKILRSSRSQICPECDKALTRADAVRTGTYFSRCAVAMSYEGKVKDAIVRYKFQDRSNYAKELGRILARCIQDNLRGEYNLITWIPVSPERLRQRGYDQAMLLAMAAALELDDVAVETLEKTSNNAAQSSLTDAAQRLENVKDAYRVCAPEIVEGKRILLIDDVITTGATMDEAGRTLLEAGAAEVFGAALAQPV